MDSFSPKKPSKIRRNSNLDLLDRIYNQGFTLETLPSVQRPAPTYPGHHPLSVRVATKNQSLIPIIYQSQPSILHKTANAFFEKAQSTSKSKKQQLEGTSKNTVEVHSKKQVERKELEAEETFENDTEEIAGPKKGFNKTSMRMLPPIDFNLSSTANFFNGSQFLETLRKNSPSFEVEARQSRFLMDKLSGKLNMDKRYLNATKSRKLHSLAKELILVQEYGNKPEGSGQHSTVNFRKSLMKQEDSLKKPTENPTNTHEIKKKSSIFGENPNKTNNTDTSDQPSKDQKLDKSKDTRGSIQWDPGYKRPASKVDKYIELIMKNVMNLDEFIYLFQDPADGDPYNLEVVEYETLKDENLKDYYTISKKGLCHYENGKPNEFIPLALWLKERETYDRIKSLKFFRKFRKWKTLKMWKRNIIRSKRTQYKKSLEEGLFVLNNKFRQTLIEHRSNCMEMEKLRIVDMSPQQYGLSLEIPRIDEFQELQAKKREAVKGKIHDFSNKCRDNVRKCFNDCLEILKSKQNSKNIDPYEEEVKKNANANAFRLRESAYENLGFDDELSYEQRSELRKECMKFLRFAYLIDFLTMDSLKNIYIESIFDLFADLGSVMKIKENVVYHEKGQKGNSKYREPLFYLNVVASFGKEIDKKYIFQQSIKEYVPPPLGTSKFPDDFNILCHVNIKPESALLGSTTLKKDSEDATDDEEDIDAYDYNKTYTLQLCPSLYKIWLSLQPNPEEFLLGLQKAIQDGFLSLQCFERWSRHDDMTPYVNILEEWDDLVGDNWEMPDSNFLDPNEMLDPNTIVEVNSRLKQVLDEAFQRTDKYLAGFNRSLMIYWENSRVNLELFKSRRLIREVETIQCTLQMLNFQRESLDEGIPYQADLGLFRVDSSELRDLILPSPENLLKKFQQILPEQLRIRLREVREWLFNSSQTMKSQIAGLEDFVKQRNAVKLIETDYPSIKKQLDTLNLILMSLKEAQFELKKDDDQLSADINHLAVGVSTSLSTVLDTLEKDMEKNAFKISKELIPKLEKATNDLDYKVKDSRYVNKDIPVAVAIEELDKHQADFQKLETSANKYRDYQRILGLEVSEFEDLRNLKEELELRLGVWKGLQDWSGKIEGWRNGKFAEIDSEKIMVQAEYYTNIVRRAGKKLPPNPVLDDLRNSVTQFKDAMPVIIALRNKNLSDYHWKEIKELIPGLEQVEDMTLNELLQLNVGAFVKEIQEISTQASQEAVLEREFEQIQGKWMNLEFSVAPYKSDKTKDLYVLTDIDELFMNLDENLASLNNVIGSRFLKSLRPKAEELHRKLMYAQETIDDWLVCQKNWIYLENIFDAQDIRKKLQNESTQFEAVDKSFRGQMRKTYQLRILNKVLSPEIGKMFKKHKDTLNQIQKALEAYLELKRSNFPRFYFLSNDELLEILANAMNLPAIQKHMKKCFDNIYKLYAGEDPKSTSITAMISGEGEKVEFNKLVSIRSGDIEHWLNQVQEQMRDTISRRMKEGRNDIELTERKKWVLQHHGQVVATVAQLSWCATTEFFLDQMKENPNSLAEWFQINFMQLGQLTELVREALDPIKHKIVVALITQDVHARDIIETLTNENVNTKMDFQWQQQLRYYWDESPEKDKENIYVLQINARLKYGYEYMGATSRLVVTPLTDRCWITITGALNIKLGAAPAGPAGTGKTESTKDLAKALGMLCVVFNCSEQIEHRMMARLFSGLAQQGAWSCLDEFNRIDIEVLSVIAQQLLVIRQNNLKGEKKFFFINDYITLKEGFGVFITMNPGYAGRTELPDNLKVLFRPVSMMIPDYRRIAEIILFSEGFENSNVLSNKMAQLYKLSSEQLSQQKHYDFGMRAVKSVLVMAGSLKRADPNSNEDGVLIKAMKDSNIPKFLKEDIPLFLALIQDLFPDANVPNDDYTSLVTMVERGCKEMGLQNVEKQIRKVIQLFETFNVRFGVMIVGFTGSGKTINYKLLQYAMNELRKSDFPDQRMQVVHTYILNPKCIAMGELYGEVNPFTDEWQDGLASKIMREIATDEAPDRKNDRQWVVFDGPVDALWIENMNTVLDDNMMLCLANGQRIKLRNEMRMLFEVNDLAVASPATVSRCGMVYMTVEELGWRPYVISWLDTMVDKSLLKETNVSEEQEAGQIECIEFFNKEFKKLLLGLFDDVVGDLLKLIRGFQEPIATTDLQLVAGLCNLMECFLTRQFGFRFYEKTEVKRKFILNSFAFACVWSLAASVTEEYHAKIDDFFRKRFTNILFPSSGTVFDVFFDSQSTDLSFKSWNDRIKEFVYLKDAPYFNLMVQTSDTVKLSFILEWLLTFEKRPFVTGGTGVGKSMIIKNLLQESRNTMSLDAIYMMFSAATESLVIQTTIENKLEKFKKTLYGAKPGRKAVIFIDDVNMPAVEQYGAQPPIELLRLMIDKGGFYDRKEKFWKEIQSTSVLAAAAPPTGGRNKLTPRFTRHFNMLCMPQPSADILLRIFNSILMGFLTTNNFQDCAKRLSDSVVRATIEVYERIVKEKKAIPSKFFYTFNLRDVSKVFQGMLMVRSYTIKEPEHMVRLWVHETSRVFHDRLINNEDRTWFNTLLIELLSKQLNMRWTYEEVFERGNKILYGDLLKLDTSRDYEEIKDMKKLLKVFNDKLDDYNFDPKNKNKLNLVFFEDAIEHILRSSRILRQPRGNLMLIGVGGSGKQSLTRLSSFLIGYTLRQIELTKGFNEESFRDFLRDLLQQSGLEGEKIAFLFTDSQIQESFLEDINNLLNSGEVPNIWEQQEDKDRIIGGMRNYHVNVLKQDDTPDLIYSSFVERVRDCLHIVLCLSPIGDGLRIRCRKFPSLVDCCTLDWFAPWPDDALISVATNFLSELNAGAEGMREALILMCKEVHVTAIEQAKVFDDRLKRKVFITPKSYLDFLNLYQKLLEEKREELSFNIRRLGTGVSQLANANSLVAQLKIDLTRLQPQLEEQNKEMDKALLLLEKDSAIALEQELLVSREREEINKQTQEIKILTDDAQSDLDIVRPELEAAEKAIENIDEKQIVTMRTYPSPPQIVEDVMAGVCILFGVKYDWAAAKSMMQNLKSFIHSLLSYPKDNIKEDTLVKLRKHRNNPNVCFKPEELKSRAPAAADLCTWCVAMDTYATVSKKVAPKKAKVALLQSKLEASNAILQQKEDQVAKVKASVAKLRQDSDVLLQRKNETERMIKQTMTRLENAGILTSLLKEEGERWQETIKKYEEETITIAGDMFLATAVLNYCSAFTGVYRQELLAQWVIGLYSKNVPLSSETPSIVKIMGNPITLREWTMNGLPGDVVSLENAIFASKASKYPLFIDPQLQAKKWLRKMEEPNGLKLMKFSDTQFQINMKGALTMGYPVLIQDTEDILDPVLDTILSKVMFKSNDGRVSIRFAEQDLEFNETFRLFLTTKLPNPDYLPDVFIKTNVINFTVTFDGLEEQLLADVVKHERPSIEQERDENIVNLAGFRNKILESENLILKLLSEAKSDTLLDDVDLIKTLQTSKTAAIEIDKQIKASVELEENIEKARNLYKAVSIRGSVLYFVIKDLSSIDPMYQYSLQYITKLFNTAIHSAQNSEDLEQRINNLIENLTRHIFTNVCRGLFEEHKLIFSFLISVSIRKQAKLLDDSLWNIFLRGVPQITSDKKQHSGANKPPDPSISQKFWETALWLQSNNPKFANFCRDLPGKLKPLQDFIDSLETSSVLNFPEPWKTELDEFEQLLIVYLYRPEKLMFSMSNFIKQSLGSFYLESPEVGMSKLFNDSDCRTPIIFVLSQGADPTDSIIAFAKERELEDNLHIISLGQGQGPGAERLIEDGRKSGHWVFLQNCHLARTWMPRLELILEALNSSAPEDTNPEFRLYLTSMPTTYFPISVLQNGIKLTTEPPRGIKANLRRAFADINQEFLDNCTKDSRVFHKLLWGLAFFHAIVLERRKFGPLGWNIRYEFNDSDLSTSKTVMLMLLNEQEQIPWDALVFVTGHINYGGRVTDDWDRKCLLSILKKFYVSEALDDSYRFSETDFILPPISDLASYRTFIENLPQNDDPEIFGLHANANISYQSQEAQRLITSMLMVEPRVSGGGSSGAKNDETVMQLISNVTKELPENLIKDNGNKELFQENEFGLIPSLSTVLLQEIERFNKLLSRMRATMQGLSQAIQGLGLMSQDLDEMYYSLLLNQVPRVWEEVAYPSLKPLASWIADLKERLSFMSDWLINGNPNCFWLSGFYFPQGFLTGVLQTHARKYKIPIDKLQFNFRVMEEKEAIFGKPLDGVYVYGLFLVGASWDKKKKTMMNQPPGEMKFKMPVILFTPTEEYEPKNSDYVCPVYKTSLRRGILSTTGQSTNYILAVDLPSPDDYTDFWVLRGAAMLTQLDD